MFILLEFIFQGFFEWIYSLILEIWNFFFASLLDIMTLDFAYIKAHVPVVEDIMEVFLAVGWALLLGNLVFQATRSMVSGLGFEGEDPKLLFARTFVFSFLLLACPQLCEIGLNLTSKIMTLLDVPDAINVHLVDGSIFGTLTAAWLLVIIFDIILMFMVLKLLMEVAERYVILAVLTITAPLAFSMGGSKNTADIFTGWCRMFGSMCLLMVTNVMFFKMLLSVVSTVPSGLDVFPWMVLNVSIVKAAKKADEIITRIGLNPAITGDKGKGFGSALIYTVFRNAATKAVKVIGAAATGGASAAAGAAAGGAKAAAGAAGAAGAKGAAGAAGGFFRFGRQWGGAQRPGTAKGQPAGSSPQNPSNGGGKGPADQTGKGPASQTGKGPVSQPGQQSSSSRKSSVPQGARRGTSNVTGATETSNTQPGGGFTGSGARRPGGFSMGGRPGGGAGRETLRHSGRTGRAFGTGQRRGVDVYVDDDFNDGIVGLGGNFPPQGTSGSLPAGGVRRGQHSSPERTTPPAESTPREGGVRRGGGTSPQGPRQQGGGPARPPEARSTRRGPSATPPTSGGGHTTSAGSTSTTQTDSTLKQRISSTVRQEQRLTSSAELSASQKGRGFTSRLSRRPADGPAGTRGGADGTTGPRPKRQASGPARQESGKRPAPAATPARSSGAMAPPGPAGTGRTSYAGSARRSRDRSPSPARQELSGGAIPRGTLQRSGAPGIHPGLAGTGSRQIARTTSQMKQRSTSPVRQEPAKAPAPAGPPVKGGGSIAHTSGPPVRTDSPPRQRSSSPAKQEPMKAPVPPSPPIKTGSPIIRPDGRPAAGPAGTVKGPPPAKRTSRTKPDASKQGGPNGKPGV